MKCVFYQGEKKHLKREQKKIILRATGMLRKKLNLFLIDWLEDASVRTELCE